MKNKQEIFDVELPEKTESYTPVSHEAIITEIQENVDKSGLEIVREDYQTNTNGEQLIGYYDLEAGSEEFNYRLAFQNSYDKSMTIAFVGGTEVMICSNGMIIGDEEFIRKHTGSVNDELTEKIKRTIGNLDDVLTTASTHAEQMKQIELDRTATAELCGRFFMEQEILSIRQLSAVEKQLKDPDYPEFADPTLWSLYNHVTHIMKENHPLYYVDRHEKLHDFVVDEFQLD